MKEYMKVEEGQREKLKTEMERLHTYITQLSQTFYDPDKEKHLLTVKKELDYYSLPIIDTGILKYDGKKERFIFKSVREDLPLSAGMDLEILVEDYFTEEKHWVRTKLDYLPQAAGGTQASGWYITEDKELELEGVMARIRKKN